LLPLQLRPQAPQWAVFDERSVQTPEAHSARPAGHAQAPDALQTPLVIPEHDPLVRGVALQVSPEPPHTRFPHTTADTRRSPTRCSSRRPPCSSRCTRPRRAPAARAAPPGAELTGPHVATAGAAVAPVAREVDAGAAAVAAAADAVARAVLHTPLLGDAAPAGGPRRRAARDAAAGAQGGARGLAAAAPARRARLRRAQRRRRRRATCPLGHDVPQTPAEQVADPPPVGAGQRRPQAPQFATSASSVDAGASQRVCPAPQPLTQVAAGAPRGRRASRRCTRCRSGRSGNCRRARLRSR
jgi:hypothetical protein